MPDVTEIGLRVMGAFYMFAGVVAVRAALTSRLLDQTIAALERTPPPTAETHKSWWLVASSVLVYIGGVALLALLDAARWLFLLSAAGQALYLFALAPHYFDKADAPDARGRQQTTNAFVVYVAATALVWWAGATGRLVSVDQASPVILGVAAAAAVAYAGHVLRRVLR